MQTSKPAFNRLVLGTAQFGMRYGIANKLGQPDLRTAEAIVATAWEVGVREFDTAQAYGESEKVLGSVLKRLGIGEEVRIISKFSPDLDHLDRRQLSHALDESLAGLHISKLAGMMLHREEHLNLWGKGLKEICLGFIEDGRVDRIGVSVYSPKKAIQALQTNGIDIVQLPTNILDRRFVDAGVFNLAEQNGKKLYIRSVFLQGLLLMDPHALPGKMQFARPILEKLQSVAKEFNMTRLEMSLGYIEAQFPKAKIIFGMETVKQIKKIVRCWNSDVPQTLIKQLRHEVRAVDERILNPVLWPK